MSNCLRLMKLKNAQGTPPERSYPALHLSWILVLILVLSLISCAVNPVTGERELMLVSESQEIEIGREAAPSLNWAYGGEFHDPALKQYLEGIVRRIWQNAERPYLPFRFTIQNTSVPNAFALPGYVAITRGLLADLQNEAQFAAVMGHEVGHVMARHTAKRISLGTLQQLGLVVGGVALGGKEGSDVLLRLGAIGSSLLLLRYDREQELQADRLGVRYMAALGYDPYEAIKAHQRLKVAVDKYLKNLGKTQKEDTFLDAVLSTHPREEIRKEEMLAMIKQLPPYHLRGDGRFAGRFQAAIEGLRKINRVYFVYDRAVLLYNKDKLAEAEKQLRKAISMNSEQAPFYNLYGMISLKQERYSEAGKYFKEALLRDKNYQPSYYGLGLAGLKSHRYRAAIEQFRRSLELYPDHPGSHFGMGKSYFNLERYARAIPHLREFASQAPRHPEVHGLLGISYERTGDIRAAVRQYELQVKVAPGTMLGWYARERLYVLRPLLR
ncbi:TPR repeat-containing protein YfgC precursor [bacterium BMS3Abin08]|nr:TPR repeat-containing protein YfgC precursor [bacterium BMS3Abin08]